MDDSAVADEVIKDRIREHIRRIERENDLEALVRNRKTLALSADRQWFVVLHPQEGFIRYERCGTRFAINERYEQRGSAIEDIGQDAQEVLEEWMATHA